MHEDFSSAETERLSARHHMARRRAETEQQRSYAGLDAARRAAGVARLVMGVHLVSLHETDGWRGRTGAVSFRRFLLEEGVEPKAAHQYMTVARAFVLEHGVSPEAIATVGMRVLVDATQYLRADDPLNGIESNVDEVVELVSSMPAAEARLALQERFAADRAEPKAQRLSRPVYQILGLVDGLAHEQRAELYQALRAGPTTPARSVLSSASATATVSD